MGFYFGLETILRLCQILLVNVPLNLTKITHFVSYRLSQDFSENCSNLKENEAMKKLPLPLIFFWTEKS